MKKIGTDGTRRILLVEDDTFLQQLYKDLLKTEGFEVTTSGEGNDALAQIVSGKWDLVLLDVMLPGLNGFEIVTKAHEKIGKDFSFPIVFMTNLDSSDDDKKKLQQGTEYWIKSNMSPPEFIEKVKKILK